MTTEMFNKCYLDYVGLGVFNPNDFTNPQDKNDTTYNDPDECSKELYYDLIKIYTMKFKKMGFKLKYANYDVLIESQKYIFTMSSDYIGPSRARARAIGIDSTEVGEYLKQTRILGGHILFPKSLWVGSESKLMYTGRGRTINTSRGGDGGFCDRIDCLLYDIKQFYENEESKLILTYNKYKDWLSLFSDFPGFIEFFCLNDFCNKNYEIYDLATFDYYGDNMKLVDENYKEMIFFKITDEVKYRSFINGNKRAIELRNIRLQEVER